MATLDELNQIESSLDYIVQHRIVKEPPFETLRNNCAILRESARTVFGYAGEYTYGGVQANGYTSYLKVLLRFGESVESKLRGRAYLPADPHLNLTSQCLLNYYRQIEQFRARSHRDPNYDIFTCTTPRSGSPSRLCLTGGSGKHSRSHSRSNSPEIHSNKDRSGRQNLSPNRKLERKRSLLAPPEYRKVEFFHYYRSERDELSTLYGYYNGFWLSPSVQIMHNLIAFLVAVFANFPFSLNAIWNPKRRGELIWDSLYHATVNYPFQIWNITEHWWYRKLFVNLYNFFVPTKSTTLHVSRQTRYQLNRLGGLMDLDDENQRYLVNILDDQEERRRHNYPTGQHKNGRKIRCRLIKCTKSMVNNPSLSSGTDAIPVPPRRKRSKSVNFNETFNKNYSDVHRASLSDEISTENLSLLGEILKQQQQQQRQEISIATPDLLKDQHIPIKHVQHVAVVQQKNEIIQKEIEKRPDSPVETLKKPLRKFSQIWKRKKSPKKVKSNKNNSEIDTDQSKKQQLAKPKRGSNGGGHLLNIKRIFRTNKPAKLTSSDHSTGSESSLSYSPSSSVSSAASVDIVPSKNQLPIMPSIVITPTSEINEPFSGELPEYQPVSESTGGEVVHHHHHHHPRHHNHPRITLNKEQSSSQEQLDEVFAEEEEDDDHQVQLLQLQRSQRGRLDSSSDIFYQNLTHFLDEERRTHPSNSSPDNGIADGQSRVDSPQLLQSLTEPLTCGNPHNTVILHAHGGGFLTQSPDSHELYLRRWVSNLGSIPMLSVDYSLSVAYPIALQEMLDVYLWLVSGNSDVVDAIGIRPKRIVVCGDSAGGMLCLVLLMVLNDLNQMLHDRTGERVMMPEAFVGFYPAFTATSLSPSKLLAKMESVLSIGPLMTVIGVYSAAIYDVSDFRRVEQSPEYRAMLMGEGGEQLQRAGLADSLQEQNPLPKWAIQVRSFRQILNEWSSFLWPTVFMLKLLETVGLKVQAAINRWMTPKYTPWYVCDGDLYDRRTNYLIHMLNHPYGSPLVYDHFDQLKNIKMYLISSHLDPLLDDNVELARKWQGDVKLDVCDHVPHGFLYYTYISKEAHQASQLCLKRLQQACGM